MNMRYARPSPCHVGELRGTNLPEEQIARKHGYIVGGQHRERRRMKHPSAPIVTHPALCVSSSVAKVCFQVPGELLNEGVGRARQA
jgi:hypothetical protein